MDFLRPIPGRGVKIILQMVIGYVHISEELHLIFQGLQPWNQRNRMGYVIEKVEWKGLLFHVKNNVFACYNRCIALIGIIFLLHFSRLERVLQVERDGINRLLKVVVSCVYERA